MSAHDYYDTPPRQLTQPYPINHPAGNPLPPIPQYESRDSSVAPSYHSQPSYTPAPVEQANNTDPSRQNTVSSRYTQASYNPQRNNTVSTQQTRRTNYSIPDRVNTVSPFESTFDDHVYPVPIKPGFVHHESEASFNSSLYGNGPRIEDGGGAYRDDIPLQDARNQATDHVYDAAPPDHRRVESRTSSNKLPFVKPLKKRRPWVVWTLTVIQVVVFIAELVKMGMLTGIPIQTQPSVNPMLGPSPYVLINMGARYVECMHNVQGVQDSTISIAWPCPNSTSTLSTDPSNQCTLAQLCGFTAVPNPRVGGSINDKPEPNQWYRFILPIFLHAGIVHIAFNMLLQLTLGKEMELSIGPIRFFIVYMASGIFGFVMGGNFAATGIASTGASGSLFGIIALTLLDLLYTWSVRPSPWKDLAFIMLDIVISFALGLLPGLDNFSHIGGFLMGLVLGICILHSPQSLQQRISQEPYVPVGQVKASNGDEPEAGVTGFAKAPVDFFKGRKPAWWAWWLVRAASLVAVFIVFILLLNNFYTYRKTCSWCKYLSCLVSLSFLFFCNPFLLVNDPLTLLG